MLQPVILCGGDGTRLWPASRKDLPKQFMPLRGSTLFKQAVTRAAAMPGALSPLVVCNHNHRFLAASQLQEALAELPAEHALAANDIKGSLLLEPAGKNTAPAIALAALQLKGSGCVMLVLPADHSIAQPEGLAQAVSAAMPAARDGALITFGVVPTAPETGYGYIQQGAPLGEHLFKVAQFVEKPEEQRARQFLAQGGYLWNSGMFLFTPESYLQELERFAPAIYDACTKAFAARSTDMDFLRVDAEEFAACPADSIDYAVFEHTSHACVVPLHTQWSDLGSWGSLYDTAPHDENQNATEGDVLLHDCKDSFVFSQSRLVAGIGLSGLVVVETPDAVMVAQRGRDQEVKAMVQLLKKHKRPEAEKHARVYRPWGSYESLIIGDRFQVKRIVVLPGQHLSLQKHYHRAEHWVVVRGTATVTVNTQELLLKEDESTYIPIGTVHRLSNHGKLPLEIIEIQTGSYLGEDDIVRLEDIYGR